MPLGIYLSGAAVAVAASFVVAAVVTRPPGPLPRYPMVELPRPAAAVGSVLLRLTGLAWWFGAIYTGLAGGFHQFAPTVLFWILIWVGLVVCCAALGNPWPALSPFRTLWDVLELLARAVGVSRLGGLLPYPARLARWPALLLLLAGLAFEFVVPGSLDGRLVAWMLIGYTEVTLAGMLLFGRSAWLRNGELLEVLFGWFGRIGPIGRRSVVADLCDGCPEGCLPERCVDCPDCTVNRRWGEQALVARPWFAGLTEVRAVGWSDAAFVLLALAGVTFDGLRETAPWGVVINALFQPVQRLVGPLYTIIAIDALGLLTLWGLFVVAFALAALTTRRLTGRRLGVGSLAGAYAATLLPIAAGYFLAHYFTLILQGVLWLPEVLTDPRSVAPDITWVPAAAIWYISVGAIVIGHITAVVLAHRLALRDAPGRATLAGLPLLALMVGYTILSLWIIGQPLTVDPA